MLKLVFFFFWALQFAAAQTPPPSPHEAKPVKEAGLYATLETSMGETSMGTLKFQMFEKEAPITVRNFVDLCLGRKLWRDPASGLMVRKPLIPGTIFHRVIPGFMIQAGDPTGGKASVGFTIKDEIVADLTFDQPGRVAMANLGPDTGSSQFFITEVPTPHLNGKHTIFGQVIDNQDLVNQIARVDRDEKDKPKADITILKVTFERVGPVPADAPELAPVQKKAVPAKKAVTPAKKGPARN